MAEHRNGRWSTEEDDLFRRMAELNVSRKLLLKNQIDLPTR